MEIKCRSRRKGLGKCLICPLLAFTLVFGLVITTPGLDGEAEAVDFNHSCAVTVAPTDPKNTEMAADLDTADVVIDLYKVADAVAVDGYDTYDFKFISGYEKLGEIYKGNPNNADWRKMAQSAARYALENGTKVQQGNGVAVKTKIEGLDCGLYLMIARGSDIEKIEDYTTEVKQEDGSMNIATIAHSDKYVYTFAPELISLPSKQTQNADGTTGNTTAGNGAWLYEMNVNMKPEQSSRYGSLEIVKTLQSYNYNAAAAGRDPAKFVFQVEAELNGENVRSTVVSLSFTEAGQKSAVVDQIPVGAVCTVTEVYSGTTYHVVTDSVQTSPPIEAVDIVSVEFVNDYNETNRGGGSVTNHFVYDENADTWDWTQVPDNSTSGE